MFDVILFVIYLAAVVYMVGELALEHDFLMHRQGCPFCRNYPSYQAMQRGKRWRWRF